MILTSETKLGANLICIGALAPFSGGRRLSVDINCKYNELFTSVSPNDLVILGHLGRKFPIMLFQNCALVRDNYGTRMFHAVLRRFSRLTHFKFCALRPVQERSDMRRILMEGLTMTHYVKAVGVA